MRPNLLQFVALASAGVIKHKPGPDDIFSCGIPLPTFEDGTRAASWAQYLDETQAYLGQSGQGATDMFAGPTGRAPVRWPRNSDNKAVIPYCYQTEKVKDVLVDQQAPSYLGPAGKEAGHAISFEEQLNREGKPIYCTPDSKAPDDWNSALPHATLAIYWGGDEMGWSASVGLQPNQETPWANQLHIGDGECLHCVLQ
ncbi:unnamed protein product [Alternaria alternata]